MLWNEVRHGCHYLRWKGLDAASIDEGMAEFWRGMAADVIPQIDPDLWNYLLIDIRGVDGGIAVYPQHTRRGPFPVPWARLGLDKLGYDFQGLSETELEGLKAKEINLSYARRMITAALAIKLTCRLRREAGTLVRVFAYSEDNEAPLIEEYL